MHYFDVSLALKHKLEGKLTRDLIKRNLERDILQFVGTEGLGEGINILKLDEEKQRFILSCKENDILIRCAITLASKFEDILCVYNIHQSSQYLNTFAANSREFSH